MRRLGVFTAAVAALVAALVLVGPAVFKPVGERLLPTERPSDYGLKYEDVTFAPPDRSIALRAWWLPTPEARAAIVIVHGGGPDNRSVPYSRGLALARDLAARGYALLMIDLRNYGESDATPEGITYGDLESNDVIGAVEYVARRAPTLPVAALGFSMGGATVLRASAREPRLRAVVADSAFASASDVAAAFTHAATGLPTFFAGPFVWSAEHVHGLPLGRGATVEALRGATMPPVLLVSDAHDPVATPDHARRLAAALPRATTWVTSLEKPGPFGTHCQSYPLAPAAYVGKVDAFLQAAVASARS